VPGARSHSLRDHHLLPGTRLPHAPRLRLAYRHTHTHTHNEPRGRAGGFASFWPGADAVASTGTV